MKLELDDTLSGYNISKINENFERIEAEFQDKVLYRDNRAGEPNSMDNVLDMNGHAIINVAGITGVGTATTAEMVSFIPGAGLISNNVQDAIEELANIVEDLQEEEPVSSEYVFTYTTVAALRAGPSADKRAARTSGYYTVGDGGAANYYLDTTDLVSTDNGGSVIVASDGGRWKLSFNNYVSIKQFGCKSGAVEDCTTKIQAAMNFCKWVMIDDGYFLVNPAIGLYLNPGQKISGNGLARSLLVCAQAGGTLTQLINYGPGSLIRRSFNPAIANRTSLIAICLALPSSSTT